MHVAQARGGGWGSDPGGGKCFSQWRKPPASAVKKLVVLNRAWPLKCAVQDSHWATC